MQFVVPVHKPVTRDLGNGDHDAVCLYEMVRGVVIHPFSGLGILYHVTEDCSLIHDADNVLPEFKVDAVEHGIIVLVLRCRHLVLADIYCDVVGAMADRGARHIHSGIACADDRDLVAELIDIRIVEVVDRIEDMTESLSGYAQLARLPSAGSYKDTAISVIEQVLYAGGSAQFEIGPEHDAHVAHPAIVAVQNRLGQTEFRNAVSKDSADLLAGLENGHLVSAAGQDDRDRDACRACADHADLHAVIRRAAQIQSLETGIGNIVFDGRKMNRLTFDPAHAVSFALVLVVAHK